MEGCCHKDKGWKHVEIPIGENDTTIPSNGLYNTRIHNTGDESLLIGTLEILPGACLPIGIDWLPCAQDIEVRWPDSSTGTKRAYLTGVRVIDYCCEK